MKPGVLIAASSTAEAIASGDTRESVNGTLDDRCEDKSTGEAVNGALTNARRSETLGVELRSPKLR